MITAYVDSGICGFTTVVRVFKTQRQSTEVKLESDCEKIAAFGNQLQKLAMPEILKTPINENPVYKVAGRCNLHASCPVPCGVIKAAEIEMGLALMKNVKIVFQKDSAD